MENDVLALWQQYVKTKDALMRERLIMHYIPLVEKIANRVVQWVPSCVDPQDVYAYGTLGLISAIEKFDPSVGVKFESFASWRIKGEILDFLRTQDVLSKQQRARLRRLWQAYESLEQEKGSSISESEVAQELGCSIEDVWELLRLNNLSHSLSLDMPIGEDFALKDIVGYELDLANRIDKKLVIEKIEQVVSQMDQKAQKILELYFMEDLKLKQIGELLGISESRVSQILSKVLFDIKRKLRQEGIEL